MLSLRLPFISPYGLSPCVNISSRRSLWPIFCAAALFLTLSGQAPLWAGSSQSKLGPPGNTPPAGRTPPTTQETSTQTVAGTTSQTGARAPSPSRGFTLPDWMIASNIQVRGEAEEKRLSDLKKHLPGFMTFARDYIGQNKRIPKTAAELTAAWKDILRQRKDLSEAAEQVVRDSRATKLNTWSSNRLDEWLEVASWEISSQLRRDYQRTLNQRERNRKSS